MPTTFRQLLQHFEESARTQAAKGKRFEDFCAAFLRSDPLWSSKFDEVWLWSDWPGRHARPDTGIDLVARTRGSGELVAVQCKFYKPSATLNWEQVATFVAMLSQPDFASGMIISTAGSESVNLHKNLDLAAKPILWWRVEDFEQSRADWSRFRPSDPTVIPFKKPKALRDHQRAAITDVVTGFGQSPRGQLVMACGTGKTLTALRLAEQTVGAGGSVLFLVPSINLLSQTVLAWANDAEVPLATFAVCSDVHAGRRKDDEDMSVNDLQVPATTDPDGVIHAVTSQASPDRMTVVFSTYQSIDVISQAQRSGLGRFDLIICDEAHRTTGAHKAGDEQSTFTKIHDDTIVGGDRRLYMTATPRVYGDQAKRKAADADVVVASMDDESRFGPVFHELTFGAAVAAGLLADYKVLVLAVNEDAVSAAFQRQFASAAGELPLDDVARMVGCWHGLSKRGPQFASDNIPMQRAVAFSSTIKQSKRFAEVFPSIVAAALEDRSDRNAVRIEASHVDGATNVKVRSERIAWLEDRPGQGVCRVLSNAKCLTEGVDVPALDAVMFLNPRKSIVDVVQAVGRVMREFDGKDYGYVILPIGIPGSQTPEEALRDNEKYQVVWQVLQALRSHDERLAAEINKIDINKTSSKINVIGIGVSGGDSADNPGVTTTAGGETGQMQLDLPDLSEWRDALYARIVDRVGDRRYMEQWAADIAGIARAQESRIRGLLEHPDQNPEAVARFTEFVTALRHNLNDSITDNGAIGMLSQHLITRPVFEALFGGDEFTRMNPVSQVMQSMLDVLDSTNIAAETETLEGFYEHIRMLVGGIHTAEGRQRVITELYEKFFKKALPKESAALGIVYTPVEIVDFINRSVNDLLRIHFNASLSDEGVHILDPFTGTGTFVTRLIQSGLIAPEALERKYAKELHANELLLLAYYIAAINIETAYHGLAGHDDYRPFEGIVLTDTFQMAEAGDPMDSVYFPRNNARADRQKALDIRVIVGNPPYSVGQGSQNDDNPNLSYPTLDASVRSTYVAMSAARLSNSQYNSYIRAFRWASNRLLAAPDGGVIGFVSNGGWLDDNSADGMRRSLAAEFHHVYVYNLRGNTRTSGETARREGGQTFGPGSRNTIAITLLVRLPEPVPEGGARIHYRDIGDYLTREQKLEIIDQASVASIDWQSVAPNEHGDWINVRDPRFGRLYPLERLFSVASNGLKSNRDAWVFSSSLPALKANVERMINHYNAQLDAFNAAHPDTGGTRKQRSELAKEFVDKDPRRHSWDRGDYSMIAANRRLRLDSDMLRIGLYRPFFKRHIAFDRTLNNDTYRLPSLFPAGAANRAITVTAQGSRSPFGAMAADSITSLHLIGSDATSVFARWRYEKPTEDDSLFGDATDGPQRVSNITDAGRAKFRTEYGNDIDDDQIFDYVYGVVHSPDFRCEFESNLKKEAPRIPLVATRELFNVFAAVGRELFELHVGYETVDPYPLQEDWGADVDPDSDPAALLVGSSKMRFMDADKSCLRYNDYLTLCGIPEAAHQYVVGTRSGLDWIIDRYYVSTDKDSGIVNDPNQWGLEHGEPRYIIDLVKRVVTVSVRTVQIVAGLPALTFTEERTADH